MKYSEILLGCQVGITAETTVRDNLHKKFDVTGMEEDHTEFYITILASASKYMQAVPLRGWRWGIFAGVQTRYSP